MALTDAYLITTKNLESFLNAIIAARAPDKFTQKFLESLEFKSTNDRLFIKLLRSLGFLDGNGTPTQRYHDFLDQSQSKTVMAEAIKDAYGDLFNVKKDANTLSAQDVKGKLRTLTQGKKSDDVYNWMANTFIALSSWADFSTKRSEAGASSEKAEPQEPEKSNDADDKKHSPAKPQKIDLHYNIQIHLPETRDTAVYDAIFQSMKKHMV